MIKAQLEDIMILAAFYGELYVERECTGHLGNIGARKRPRQNCSLHPSCVVQLTSMREGWCIQMRQGPEGSSKLTAASHMSSCPEITAAPDENPILDEHHHERHQS